MKKNNIALVNMPASTLRDIAKVQDTLRRLYHDTEIWFAGELRHDQWASPLPIWFNAPEDEYMVEVRQ